MKFQLGWLRDHVSLPESEADVARKLTSIGLAVDAVSGEGDAAVLDVDVTTNRVDAMCHVGLARELAAAYGRELRVPPVRLTEADEPAADVTSVTVDAPDLCPFYAARVVRGVKAAATPAWIADRLVACGIRPISIIVDVTNYVLLELGHPLHAFDLDRLAGWRIVVRRPAEGEDIRTLDGERRALVPDMLVIADARRPVAVAGVMGGADTEIGAATQDVLLESAWFAPTSVRRTARRLGLHTEASHRFERGADPDAVRPALDRAAALLADVAGGSVLRGRVEALRELPPPREVRLREARLRLLAGADVPREEIERRLPALGFTLLSADAQGWTVRVPRRRGDVSGEVDLVEEVLRQRGFDALPARLPSFRDGSSPRQPWETALAALRHSLVASGHHQAITLSFGDPAALAPWRGSLVADGAARVLRLQNPLAENLAVMRTSLVPGLLAAASLAVRHGEHDVRLFEEGHIFFAREAGAPPPTPAEERPAVALVATGRRGTGHFLHRSGDVDLLHVKGVLLDALRAVAGGAPELVMATPPGPAPNCAPGAAARVLVNGLAIGWLGRVHPDLLRSLEIAQPLFAAEVDLTTLLPAAPVRRTFRPLSRFPSVVRDLSVLVDRNLAYGDIIGAISGFRSAVETSAEAAPLEAVELTDRYLGPGIPEGQVSLTFSLSYRRHDRTLRQDEVDRLHARLVTLLGTRFGARPR